MEHRPLATSNSVLDITPQLFIDRGDRLRRWADLLEREPTRRLPTLHHLEFASAADRPGQRVAGSSLSVAFADPFLRASGLEDDTYGQARAFFGLSERQAHRLLCSCVNGPAVEGHRMAAKLRRIASGETAWTGLLRTVRGALARLRPA